MGKRGLVAFLSLKPCFYVSVSVFVCLHPGVGHEKWQSITVYYSKQELKSSCKLQDVW